MKLSKNTLNILKNFSSINQSMEFKKGNKQYTISNIMTVLAFVEIEEDIEKNFCIYDLNQLLGVLTTMGDPSIHTMDNHLLIVDDTSNAKVKIYYADPSAIRRLESEPKEVTWGDSFLLPENVIQKIYKFSGLLKSKFISFVGDGDKITVLATEECGVKKSDLSNSSSIFLTESNDVFEIFLDKDNFVDKIIPMDYKVSLHAQKLLKLENDDQKLKYILIGNTIKK
jgi:hypothetical protein